ncbi:MAG: type II toxin-antitoxin system prevent-host-death family antitoxin [Bryobacteraceae bacterium]|jgi:prevent-host-death family protein
MKGKVGIAELKAHLSYYVRAARKGREIVIKDRNTPVAKLAPLEPAYRLLRVIPATRSMAEVERMLDANPSAPVLPPGLLDEIFADTRKDVYDKWIAGELT